MKRICWKENKLKRYILICLAAVVILAGIVGARFALQWKSGSQLATASDFYFTSDLLEEGADMPIIYIDSETSGFDIKLYNFKDSKRITTKDIKYKIEATGATISDPAGGTLIGGTKDTNTIVITPDSGVRKIAVMVTATSPYKNELKAEFTLSAGNQYKVEDKKGNTAAVLTMTCTKPGDITIALPDGVIPDATDGRVAKSGSYYTFKVSEQGVFSLILLKTNSQWLLEKAVTPFNDMINLSETS